MLKEEKTRVIVFSAVSLLSVILVVWLSWGICDMTAVSPIDYDNIGEIYVDGADFTSCAMLGAGLVNGLMLMIYFGAAVIYALLAAVGAALSGVLLRVVMLRRAANIGAAELSLTRRIFIAVSAAGLKRKCDASSPARAPISATNVLRSARICWRKNRTSPTEAEAAGA